MSIALNRIEQIFDTDSFQLMDSLSPTIHILGTGTINKRRVYCCAGDKNAKGFDILECFHRKVKWLEKVIENPAPIVWLHDAPPQVPGGHTPIPACADELLASSRGVGRVFCLQARLMEMVPQIAVSFCDLGAAQTFPLRLSDFTLLKEGTHTWIGRPDAVKLMIGSKPDADELGGARMHCTKSGVGDVLFENDEQALTWIKRCLNCLPTSTSNCLPIVPSVDPESSIDETAALIPDDLNKPFDIRPIINSLIDSASWIGIRELYAKEVITGLARIGGIPVGIVANNSAQRGGIIFPETCKKMTRFIHFCDKYSIPMIFCADNPGLMVGVQAEQGGLLLEASELLRALATATNPRACLVIRKAYTVGLYTMSGPGFDPSYFWATPQASISIFGPKALDCFTKNRNVSPTALKAIQDMHHHAVNPEDYKKKGYLSGIIQWKDLRNRLEEFMQECVTNKE